MNSVWSKDYDIDKRESLSNDIKVDTVVIGAGITGLLTAYKLKKKGIDVIVIDRGRAVHGNTLNTTAKITSQHDLIYADMLKEFGYDNAKKYATANELAIKDYKEIIKENNIDCDFKECDAYIYSLDDSKKIEREYEVALKLGIDAEMVDEIELQFKIEKALKFKKQAHFNPVKFLNHIAKDLKIYEDTRAIDIKDNTVITDKAKISADNIVVATHFPIINTPGYYFMRMHQERSCVIALKVAGGINGMYIDENKDGFSFRQYDDFILIGGSSKRTGDNETGGCYEKIREFYKSIYPNAKEEYTYSAQDCITSDSIPYIGRYSKEMDNVYVATGFNKWGMTSSMVSANIISDMITKNENDYMDIFSPERFDFTASIGDLLKDGVKTAYNFIAQKIHLPLQVVENIKEGHGGIVIHEGEKVGVYKENGGKFYTVSTKCPHLGCELKWNSDERSWDCPCHGSRFDYKGNFLNSPSIKDLNYEE